MKILGHPTSPMYLWAIVLLSSLAVISAYTLHVFPLPLVISVASAGAAEVLIRRLYLKHAFRVPYSGIITGLIIGAIAPINAPLPLALMAAAVAVASKFLVQYKGSNILNPASAGLLVALPLFGLGDEWWIASNYNVYGMAITLTPVLVILAYEARRLPAALSFAAVSFVLAAALSAGTMSTATAVALLFGINYFFAFVMLVEPKTSPSTRYVQLVYGGGMALLYLALTYLRVAYPLLIGLLIGNILYAAYRKHWGRR